MQGFVATDSRGYLLDSPNDSLYQCKPWRKLNTTREQGLFRVAESTEQAGIHALDTLGMNTDIQNIDDIEWLRGLRLYEVATHGRTLRSKDADGMRKAEEFQVKKRVLPPEFLPSFAVSNKPVLQFMAGVHPQFPFDAQEFEIHPMPQKPFLIGNLINPNAPTCFKLGDYVRLRKDADPPKEIRCFFSTRGPFRITAINYENCLIRVENRDWKGPYIRFSYLEHSLYLSNSGIPTSKERWSSYTHAKVGGRGSFREPRTNRVEEDGPVGHLRHPNRQPLTKQLRQFPL